MDTSDIDIKFDNEGVCNHCTSLVEKLKDRGYIKGVSENTLEQYLETIKTNSKRSDYDCVLGVSGGVDSSYTAYLCSKFNLRTLLVHVDNGWNSDIAVSNIRALVDRLKFDYLSYVLDWSEFREIQLAFLKSSSVDLEMTTDIAIFSAVHRVAVENDIKYIVSGCNLSSEGILPVSWGYHTHKDLRMYKYIVKKYSNKRLKNTPVIGLQKEAYYRFIKKVKTIYPLNYLNYDRHDAKEFLRLNLGWQGYGGKHHESKITAFWQGYVMVKKFGMDYRRATLSAEICRGSLDRDQALRSLASPPYDEQWVEEISAYVAKKFGITLQQMEVYLAQPPKTFHDFPNNKEFIEFCYSIYTRFFNSNRV